MNKATREKQKLYDEWKSKRDVKASPQKVYPQSLTANQWDIEIEQKRAENRRKFPEFAAFYDEVRKHFPGAYVTSITMKGDQSPASPVSDVADAQDDQQ